MDEAPPQEGDGVGQIRKTYHLMVLRGPFPPIIQAFHFIGVMGGQQGKQTDRLIATDN